MNSLRARLITALCLGFLLLTFAGGLAISLRVEDTLEGGFDESLLSEAQALASRLELEVKPEFRQRITSLGSRAFSGPEGAGAASEEARQALLDLAAEAFQIRFAAGAHTLPAYGRGERPDYFEIWRAQGGLLARSVSLGEGRLARSSEPEATRVEDLTLPDGRPGRAVILRVSDVGFPQAAWTRAWELIRQDESVVATTVFVMVAKGVEQQTTLLASLRRALFVTGFLLLLAAGLWVWLVTTSTLAPLRRLQEQVQRLDAHSLHERVQLGRLPAELAPVVSSLNESLERLEHGFKRERKTAAHIAHELRTPIAELQSITDVARQWPEDEALQARCVEQGHEIAEHMSRIVSALLRVARAGTAPALQETELDLAQLIAAVWRRLKKAADARGQSLQTEVSPETLVYTDAEVLETLLANLLRNAIDHAPAGSRIECKATPSAGGPVGLTISNPCPDLAPEDLPNVTQLFWRKDEARSHSLQGGLGLPLVQELSLSAGISFEVALREGSFVASLLLPARTGAAP